MKKISIIISVFIILSSCTKLEDLNKNTKDPSAVSGESLFTGAQKNLFDQMWSANVNMNIFRMFAQYWTETTYIDEANYDLMTRTIPDNHWDVLYRDVLKDLKESAKIIGETEYPTDPSPAVKKNRLAIVDIMAVYTWSVLVETFGDIPYTKALDIEIPLPAYDDGETVYKDLITRLDADMADMDPSPSLGSFDAADNMYNGDVASWLKFANSLKLRMGMLLSDVDATYAKTIVEEAAADPVGLISSNSEKAQIIYLASQPNTNPIYDDLVASGRNDFVAANTIVDFMDSLNDPRMPYYFTYAPSTTTYIGGLYGESNDFASYSHVADDIQLPDAPAVILDYTEVEFLLAEACEKGFTVGGTAESHYDAAITASITDWGGSATDASTYLAQADVAYTTAGGTYQQKIGVQKWLALYNRGFEAWQSWRKFDYPVLIAPPEAVSDVPVRFTYPIAEQTLNGANWTTASAAIGGDDVAIKLFWDLY